MADVRLSRRALRDIRDIERYSIIQWGQAVADEYIDSIQAALDLLRRNSGLLRTSAGFPTSFGLYRVRQHFLVCSVLDGAVFVLTVKHGAMDLPARLGELEPSLSEEAKLLHRAYLKQRSSE